MEEPKPPTLSFPQVIDSSMMEDAACQYKFFIKHVLKKHEPGTSVDLHAGGAIAHALEAARLSLWVDKQPLDKALEVATEAFIEFWGDYEAPENHAKDFVNTINAIYSYFEEYPPHTDKIEPYLFEGGRPAVEFTFAIPLPIMHPDTNEPLVFAGRFDLLGYYHNSLYIQRSSSYTEITI